MVQIAIWIANLICPEIYHSKRSHFARLQLQVEAENEGLQEKLHDIQHQYENERIDEVSNKWQVIIFGAWPPFEHDNEKDARREARDLRAAGIPQVRVKLKKGNK